MPNLAPNRVQHRTARWVLPLLMGLAAAMAPPPVGAVTQVELLDAVTVRGDTVLLGQIAEVFGDEPELTAALEALYIAKAPVPGEERVLDTAVILNRLRQRGYDGRQVRVTGSRTVRIVRRFQSVPAETLQNMVAEFARSSLIQSTPSAVIREIIVPGEELRLPEGRITYEFRMPNNGLSRRKVPVHVHVAVDGQPEKKLFALVSLEIVKPVAAARHTLERGRLVTDGDVFVRTMDVSDLPSNIVTDPDAVLGQRVKKTIDALEVIRADMVEHPPLVKKGDIVEIVAESDTLRISTMGRVQGVGGREGDRVRVTNLDSSKGVWAKVVDEKTVQVEWAR